MSIEVDLIAIGKRIEELRGRLSQSDFAARLGVDRKTVGTWERGERLLDTKGLVAIWAEFDADPAWLLTGEGYAPKESEDERELLALFRLASLEGKAAAIGALSAKASKGQKKPRISVGVNHGQVVEAGKIVNQGPISFGNVTNKKS